MNQENKQIIGYNPQTGEPIYQNQSDQQLQNQQMNQTYNLQVTNNNQSNNKDTNKYIKILVITNIITVLLLIGFICAFVVKCNNTNNKNNSNNNYEEFENNGYVSTATDKPVSKDWTKYQFSINNKTLTLPCSYKEFKDISGFFMKSSDEKSYIQRNYSTNVNLYTGDLENGKLALYIDIKNNTNYDLKYSDSEIVRIGQTLYQVETNGADIITFPGDLKVGMEITKEEIVKLFGEPDKIRDSYGISITYNNDETYSTINYYEIELLNGKINQLTLDHKKNENN